MGRSVVRETEAGLYPDVSKHYSRSLGKLAYDHGIDAQEYLGAFPTLNDAYHNWQAEQRKAIYGQFDHEFDFDTWSDSSPAEQLRDYYGYTVKGWCALILVPRSPWTRYETGAQLAMPASVENALVEVSFADLRKLQAAQQEWVKLHG